MDNVKSELSNRKVVEHNDLITSVAKMDKVPLKIFELAVSCIDADSPPLDNVVHLSKKELFDFFDVDDSNKHTRFNQAAEKMQKQSFFEIKEKKGKGFKYTRIVPIPYIEWNDYNDDIIIRFDVAIMPYLIDLKRNFTQYAISDIMELQSKYSIIIYKWLSMNFNQYEHYKFKGNRRLDQLDAYKNPVISVDELRKITDTEDIYERFTNFSKRVIDVAIQEITKFTHFNVSYDKKKYGRSVTDIQFFIDKKKQAPSPYKNNDVKYLENKKIAVQEKSTLVTQALESVYTDMLMDNMLIGVSELRNVDTMFNLQKNVYPLYEDLKEVRGLEGVRTHLSYVSSKREPYSDKNIVKYLHKAIEQYLVRVKVENQG